MGPSSKDIPRSIYTENRVCILETPGILETWQELLAKCLKQAAERHCPCSRLFGMAPAGNEFQNSEGGSSMEIVFLSSETALLDVVLFAEEHFRVLGVLGSKSITKPHLQL